MLDACPTIESDGGEFSQLIHIFSLKGVIEKISMYLMESHLKSTPPCSADKLLTSNILVKIKFIFQKRKFDYQNLNY